MTLREMLIEEIKTLPDDLAAQVFDYVAFVRSRAEGRPEAFVYERAVRKANGHVLADSSNLNELTAPPLSEAEYVALRKALKDDPLVGMFSGSDNLATDAEEILANEFGRED